MATKRGLLQNQVSWVSTGRMLPSTGMSALEMAFASMYAPYRFMIGRKRLTASVLIRLANRTAFNAWPVRRSALHKR